MKYSRLENYAEEYSDTFVFDRRDGIIQVQFRPDGGPGSKAGWYEVWSRAWAEIGRDPENKVMILTSTGDRWLKFPPVDEGAAGNPNLIYETYYDVVKNTENLIFGISIPTIGAINGPAALHFESALFCDITLCAEGTLLRDPHCELGVAPGDGVGMAIQHLVGPKWAAYYLYTSDPIDAETAFRLGMVNEVLPREKLLPRAWELAERIARMPDLSRLMAKQIVRRSAQRLHVEDAGMHIAHQLLGMVIDSSSGRAVTPAHIDQVNERFEAAIEEYQS